MVVEGGLNFLGDFKHPQKKLLSAQDIAWSNSVFLVSRNPRKRAATFAKNRWWSTRSIAPCLASRGTRTWPRRGSGRTGRRRSPRPRLQPRSVLVQEASDPVSRAFKMLILYCQGFQFNCSSCLFVSLLSEMFKADSLTWFNCCHQMLSLLR